MEPRESCITRRSKAFQGTDRQPYMHSPPENLDSSLQSIVLRPAIYQFIAILLPLPQRPLHPFPISKVCHISMPNCSNFYQRLFPCNQAIRPQVSLGKGRVHESDIDEDRPKFLSFVPEAIYPSMAASGSHNLFSPIMAQMLRDSTFSRSAWSGSAASRR